MSYSNILFISVLGCWEGAKLRFPTPSTDIPPDINMSWGGAREPLRFPSLLPTNLLVYVVK